MDVKELQTSIEAKFADLKKQVEEKTADKAELEKKYNDLIKEFEDLKAKSDNSEKLDAMQKHIDKLDIKLQRKSGNEDVKPKSFQKLFSNELLGAKDSLVKLRNKDIRDHSILLTKADDELDPTNWSGISLDSQTTEVRGLRESAFRPMWLRNFLPNNTTTSGVIQYLKEDGWNGAVGDWDGSGPIADLENKPGVTPNFDFATETVEWIAGIARIKREMLDDVAWLRGYLSRKLLTGKAGLFVAENAKILSKLIDNSVAYDGGNANFVEAVYDAAFGQLQDNYHYPTTIVVNSRDMVNLIALNKAEGSGEYDLPPNTVANIGGQLTFGGVPVIGLPNLDPGKFLVFDNNETEFVNRMSPEVRFFEEDRDNVPKNLVTVRVEERVLPIVYDDTAVIYGEVAAEVED